MDTTPSPTPADGDSPSTRPVFDTCPAFGPYLSSQPPPIWQRTQRWLYAHNPFYLLGTCLVFAGVRMSFDTSRAAHSYPSEILFWALAGCTVLTAAYGCLLIRWGQVWDDVRSLLLLVLLFLVGMSITLDQLVADCFSRGVWWTFCLWLFSLAIVGLVFAGLNMRLSWFFAVPLVGFLTLIVIYPLFIKWLLDARQLTLVHLGLAGYPALGAIAVLTLLPAVRRGPSIAEPNGTPWRWPLYPWSLFVVLGIGFVLRAYYLCQSFAIEGGDEHFFGPHLLAPLGLAVMLLWLEETLRREDREQQSLVLGISLGVAMLGFLANDSHFGTTSLRKLHEQLGFTWPHATLCLLVLFQAWAALRQVSGASVSLVVVLLMLATIPPHQSHLGLELYGYPLIVLAASQALYALSRHEGLRAYVALIVLLIGMEVQWPEWQLTRLQGLFVWHGLLLGAWCVLGLFRDPSVALVHGANMCLIPWVSWHTLQLTPLGPAEGLSWLLYGYAPTLTLVALAFGRSGYRRGYALSAAATFGVWCYLVSIDELRRLRERLRGFDLILSGLVALIGATAISLRKGRRHRAEFDRQPREPTSSPITAEHG